MVKTYTTKKKTPCQHRDDYGVSTILEKWCCMTTTKKNICQEKKTGWVQLGKKKTLF